MEAIALPTKEATGVANHLYKAHIAMYVHRSLINYYTIYHTKVFMRMGLPKLLTTDQGSEFKNNLLKTLMKKFNVKHVFATAYHPQVGL